MVSGELGAIENPGRQNLVRFVELVELFLETVLADTQNIGFLWRSDDNLASLARATFEEDVRQSAKELRSFIYDIPESQIGQHGLSGSPLRFKFAVLSTLSNRWGDFKGLFSVEKWLKKIIDAIDAILDSLIAAASGVGALVKEFKDALRALIGDDDQAWLSGALDTLPLHEVSPKLFTLLQDFFEQKWNEGKLSHLFTDEDIHALLAVLSPYLGGK